MNFLLIFLIAIELIATNSEKEATVLTEELIEQHTTFFYINDGNFIGADSLLVV